MIMSNSKLLNPVVVIPVHKPTATEVERISIFRCGKILSNWDIVLVTPNGLDASSYHELIPNVNVLPVPPQWMSSIQAYNRLMISHILFDALAEYSHILLHEPDALVIRDDLRYWCAQNLDYIGAPWFKGYHEATPGAPIIGVGNSGFSLQRVEAALRVTKSMMRWYPRSRAVKDILRGVFGRPFQLKKGVLGLGVGGELRGAYRLYDEHCDVFWTSVVPRFEPFKVASIEAAVRFSWEVLPSRCMQLCDGNLPFGLHGWTKYELPFLTPYLREVGVELRNLA
jgi:hypothetical protein